jgi:hypothetical protein
MRVVKAAGVRFRLKQLTRSQMSAARTDASRYVRRLAQRHGVDVADEWLSQLAFPQELRRQVLLRAVAVPRGRFKPFFPSIVVLRQLDMSLVACLWQLYEEHRQPRRAPKTAARRVA